MDPSHIHSDMTVAEVLERWSATAQVFFRYRMACVGCMMSTFDRLADVASIYGLDLDRFLAELRAVADLSHPGEAL